MSILAEELSIWDISFRWAGYDPRKFYFRIPLEVEDNFRNLMLAIISSDIECSTISLEKRQYAEDDKQQSVYYWLEDIYRCIAGRKINRKLMHWAIFERLDFKEWCERMNIPLPEFWFPSGWNLSYQLPEGTLSPGHAYVMRHWTETERQEYMQNFDSHDALSETSNESQINIRPSQEAKIVCQKIATVLWKDQPDRTIASMVRDEMLNRLSGANYYVEDTVRGWLSEVAPVHVKSRRGRPRKNMDEDKSI